MKRLLITTLIFALSGCFGTGTRNTGNSADSLQVAETNVPKPKWDYKESVDEMTDAKTYFAKIEADDELEFSFPYGGGTPVYITLRSGSDGIDVMVWIPKNGGQFNSNPLGNSAILVRFDDKTAEKYYYTMPSDFSTETIFIKNTSKFIENLKTAQKTIIQCEFFNEGSRTITFDTHGLVWEH
jgi:hypothetical protein